MPAKLVDANVVFLVANIAATMAWYEDALGFEAQPFPDTPPYTFCIMTRDEVVIMLQQLDGYVKPEVYAERHGGVWNLYVRTSGVAALFASLSQRGDVKIIQRLRRQPYGQMEFEVADPNGYVLVFAEPTP